MKKKKTDATSKSFIKLGISNSNALEGRLDGSRFRVDSTIYIHFMCDAKKALFNWPTDEKLGRTRVPTRKTRLSSILLLFQLPTQVRV